MMEEDQFLRRLDCLAQELESCTDPAVRERMRGVIGILLDFHRRALAQLMQHVGQSGESAQATTDTLARDELVASLLLLHDLHPWDLETRLKQATERAASHWASLGGRVELLGVTQGGIVQLRFIRTGVGWQSSPSVLRTSIERVIHAAGPDVAGVAIAGLNDEHHMGFVPLSDVRILKPR